jgi:hypothetical protein
VKNLISELSSDDIFNNLFPGVVFVVGRASVFTLGLVNSSYDPWAKIFPDQRAPRQELPSKLFERVARWWRGISARRTPA